MAIHDGTRNFVKNFKENNLEHFQLDRILVDLEGAIESFGIKVLYSNMSQFPLPDKISGYSTVNDEGFPVIVVNGNHAEVRRRFTMAHELGHIVMHWEYNGEKISTNKKNVYRSYETEYSNDIKEIQANEFAAQFLAPLELIKRLVPDNLEELNPDDKLILSKKLGNAFKISSQFAMRQLKKVEDSIDETTRVR